MNKIDLWTKASSLRKELKIDTQSPVDIIPLVNNIDNLTLVFYPMSDKISGICIKNEAGNVIAVNSNMTMGRQNFSVAHELYHIYHDDNGFRTTVCQKELGTNKAEEQKAEQFASYFLMPPDSMKEMIDKVKKDTNKKRLSEENVIKLEQHFRISRQAMLIRLIDEGELTEKEANGMKTNIIQYVMFLGYDDILYRPLPIERQYRTYGHYIKQVEELSEKGLISAGKYDELLLEAFRTDLVYGDTVEGGEIFD